MTLRAGANIWATGDALQNPEISGVVGTGDASGKFGLVGYALDVIEYGIAQGGLGITGSVDRIRCADGVNNGQLGLQGFVTDSTNVGFVHGDLLLTGSVTSVDIQISLSYLSNANLYLMGTAEGFAWGAGAIDGELGVTGFALDITNYGLAKGEVGFVGQATHVKMTAGGYVLLPKLAGIPQTNTLDIEDVFYANARALGYQFAQIAERVVLYSTLDAMFIRAHATTHEWLTADADVMLAFAATVAEELTVSDTPQATTIRMLATAEQIRITQGVQASANFLAGVAMHLAVQDGNDFRWIASAEELLVALAENNTSLKAQLSWVESLLVNDTLTLGGFALLAIEEELVAVDSASSLAALLAQVDEGVEVYIALRAGDDVIHGWVMNTKTAGFSEYTNFPFNSFAELNGEYYGINEDGLYLLEGDTDNADPIQAAVRTGVLDMGTHYMKDVKAAHLGYTSSGEIVVKVATVDRGEKVEHWYKAKPAVADAMRDGRAIVGRGLRSRYWQFELVNVQGADIELDDVTFLYQVLSRRHR